MPEIPKYTADLLEKLRRNPQAFLRTKSLDRLSFFAESYTRCLWELRECKTPRALPGFQEFIENRYPISCSCHWAGIIRFFCEGDEEAFDEFYRLLEIFRALPESGFPDYGDFSDQTGDIRPSAPQELLKMIEKRPGVYLSRRSLDRLVDVLSGHVYCLYEHGLCDTTEILPGFQEFTEDHYDVYSGQHWSRIIDFFCFGSDEAAFPEFFRLWHEFCEK